MVLSMNFSYPQETTSSPGDSSIMTTFMCPLRNSIVSRKDLPALMPYSPTACNTCRADTSAAKTASRPPWQRPFCFEHSASPDSCKSQICMLLHKNVKPSSTARPGNTGDLSGRGRCCSCATSTREEKPGSELGRTRVGRSSL